MIFLIGMPGAGKTYWGKTLSEKYGLWFVDLDEYIEEKAGKSIKSIFDEDGEAYFRKIEADSLRQIVEEGRAAEVVIACGGGTPAFNSNIELMLNSGCVVYIEEPLTVLADRLKADIDKRPLTPVGSVEVEEQLEQLYTMRLPYYRQAHYTLSKENIKIEQFKNIIEICTDKH